MPNTLDIRCTSSMYNGQFDGTGLQCRVVEWGDLWEVSAGHCPALSTVQDSTIVQNALVDG